jgi:protein arginine kinase activator
MVAGGEATSFACCGQCEVVKKMTQGPLMPSQALGVKMVVPTPKKRIPCPTCGFRWTDFEKVLRLGCPTCYTTHFEDIELTIGRIQPGLAHVGRHPTQPHDFLVKLPKLRTLLQEAIQHEDFESAAMLRDQISELEKQAPQP